jgi:hypothetical protein
MPFAGFARAVADPDTNALHRSLLGENKAPAFHQSPPPETSGKAFEQGPNALTPKEKKELLLDPQCFSSSTSVYGKTWTPKLHNGGDFRQKGTLLGFDFARGLWYFFLQNYSAFAKSKAFFYSF